MKLLNHLFEIVESSGDHYGFAITIRLSPAHTIYKGHFPGYPVTPGVVFLQIVHELVEYHLNQTIQLIKITDCKFLKVVNPNEEDLATLSVEVLPKDKFLHVKVLGTNNSGTFLKLNAVYAESVGMAG